MGQFEAHMGQLVVQMDQLVVQISHLEAHMGQCEAQWASLWLKHFWAVDPFEWPLVVVKTL